MLFNQSGARERALAALQFRKADRFPIAGGWLCNSSIIEDICEIKDFWANSEFYAIEAARRLGSDTILQLILPKEIKKSATDEHKQTTNFTIEEKNNTFNSPDDVRDYCLSLSIEKYLENFDENIHKTRLLDYEKELNANLRPMLGFLYGWAKAPCFMFYEKFGYENYLLAIALYEDAIAHLFKLEAELQRRKNAATAKIIKENNLPPFVYFGEDICDNSGPIISPKTLRKIYFPVLEYALEPLVKNNIKIIWHSDGNISPIVNDLIACGVAGFQGFQEETGVSLIEMANKKTISGEPLLIVGSISVTSILPFGALEDVKKDVERCLNIFKDRFGFILSATSSIGPEVPIENIFAMYQHGIEYGLKLCGNISQI